MTKKLQRVTLKLNKFAKTGPNSYGLTVDSAYFRNGQLNKDMPAEVVIEQEVSA